MPGNLIKFPVHELVRREKNPAKAYVESLRAPSGRRTQELALRTIVRDVFNVDLPYEQYPWHELGEEQLGFIQARLAESYAPRTVNRMLSAVRRVLYFCWKRELITSEEYRRAVDVRSLPVDDTPAGRAVQPEETDALLMVARKHNGLARYRDPAIIAAMYGAGIRRIGISRLTNGKYSSEIGAFEVRGKRNKRRRAYVIPEYRHDIERWLPCLGNIPGPFFPRLHKSGRVTSVALTPDGIGRIIKATRLEADVAPFTPHDLRRSLASRLLDNGTDLSLVKSILGHSDIRTTALYDRRTDEAKAKAIERLSRGRRELDH